MKGIVFNLLEEIVSEQHGLETWDSLLDTAQVDGAYTSLGNYPDAELLALVGAASTALGAPADDVVRWFGRNAIPKFYERYPQLFDPHRTTSQFVVTLNDIIHPEVRKIYPGADPPEFDYQEVSESRVVMGYRSKRALCSFGEDLLLGTGEHYGQWSRSPGRCASSEAMRFLRRQGTYGTAPRPDVILLDLNLPKMDGREVLAEVKRDPDLLQIPVIVLTTSTADRDIYEAYEHRANAYITKPVNLGEFVDVVRTIESFWLTIVKLPKHDEPN